MKARELRILDDVKLRSMIDDYQQELFNLRFQKVTGKLTNISRPRLVRRDIARIQTVLREREIERAMQEAGEEVDVG
ncbi:MAG: 50S ribosomal protein L29 [Chloroflexaceae bacterium]|nr:50S ribosomal protein L29 [Chloroflexaceae bacterium]